MPERAPSVRRLVEWDSTNRRRATGHQRSAPSVDPPAAQLAMNRAWHLPFRWVSDPDGSALAKPLDAWNPDERGGLVVPLVLLVAPDGTTLVEHRSRDFADRPDDDVLDALSDLALPPQMALSFLAAWKQRREAVEQPAPGTPGRPGCT